MPKAKTMLAVDFGAATIKAAVFVPTPSGSLQLTDYGFKVLGTDAAKEPRRSELVRAALAELLDDLNLKTAEANACLPGFQTISKLVRLPQVDKARVAQIIQYEAQQHLPFPLEEMVWDFRVLGTTPSGEIEVWIVGARLDEANRLVQCAKSVRLELGLLDATSAALTNVFRYSHPGLDGCSMVLDIGAKSSTLIFIEADRTVARAISIGADIITQDFAREANTTPEEAEHLKIAEGFVGLGGSFHEPEDEHRAMVSKLARQVMTRLHVQVNQTIQVYLTQQGGSAPKRLFLSGGGASMPFTAEFFTEKLGVPVEYLNPLRNLELAPALDAEAAGKAAHRMGELVGLALRNVVHCPVEFNLMPRPLLKQHEFKARAPFFSAAAIYLLLVVLALGWFCAAITEVQRETASILEESLVRDTKWHAEFQARIKTLQAQTQTIDELRGVWAARFYWARILQALSSEFAAVEEDLRASSDTKPAIWIDHFRPVSEAAPFKRIHSVQVTFGASDLTAKAGAEANDRLVFRLMERLRQNSAFGAGTAPSAGTKPTNSVFHFNATLELKDPIQTSP